MSYSREQLSFVIGNGFFMTKYFLKKRSSWRRGSWKPSEVAEVRRRGRRFEVGEAQVCPARAGVFYLAARRAPGLSGRRLALGRAERGPSGRPALSLRPAALPLGGAGALLEPQPGRVKVVALPGCVLSCFGRYARRIWSPEKAERRNTAKQPPEPEGNTWLPILAETRKVPTRFGKKQIISEVK